MSRRHRIVQEGPAEARPQTQPDGAIAFTTFVPVQFRRKGIKKVVVAPPGIAATEAQAPVMLPALPPAADPTLLKALALGHWWGELLHAGEVESAEEIAAREGIDRSRVNDLLRLRLLPPEVVQAIADGAQPRTLTLEWLIRHPISADWERQRRNLEVQSCCCRSSVENRTVTASPNRGQYAGRQRNAALYKCMQVPVCFSYGYS